MGRAAADGSGRVYSSRKIEYKEKVVRMLQEYSKVLIVNADNVGSDQMHQIRKALRKQAEVLMGKNTMIRYVIKEHAAETKNLALNKLAELVRYNIGLVFTNGDLSAVRDVLVANKVSAPARVGSLAPVTVKIPPGPTTLEPTQTSFFQALGISTKINKGTIEILNEVELIKAGNKCGNSEVALLQKLGIRPFFYGLSVTKIYDNGSVYEPSVLDIKDEDVLDLVKAGIANVTAFSLGCGFPVTSSIPHLILNAFNNVLAVSLATDYTFPQAQKIKEILADPSKFLAAAATSAPAAKSSSAPAAAKAAEPEPEPEEEDVGMGGLFD